MSNIAFEPLLTEENTAILRTEKVLRPGLEPRYRSEVYGSRLIRNVASGDGITREDLEPSDVAPEDHKE